MTSNPNAHLLDEDRFTHPPTGLPYITLGNDEIIDDELPTITLD